MLRFSLLLAACVAVLGSTQITFNNNPNSGSCSGNAPAACPVCPINVFTVTSFSSWHSQHAIHDLVAQHQPQLLTQYRETVNFHDEAAAQAIFKTLCRDTASPPTFQVASRPSDASGRHVFVIGLAVGCHQYGNDLHGLDIQVTAGEGIPEDTIVHMICSEHPSTPGCALFEPVTLHGNTSVLMALATGAQQPPNSTNTTSTGEKFHSASHQPTPFQAYGATMPATVPHLRSTGFCDGLMCINMGLSAADGCYLQGTGVHKPTCTGLSFQGQPINSILEYWEQGTGAGRVCAHGCSPKPPGACLATNTLIEVAHDHGTILKRLGDIQYDDAVVTVDPVTLTRKLSKVFFTYTYAAPTTLLQFDLSCPSAGHTTVQLSPPHFVLAQSQRCIGATDCVHMTQAQDLLVGDQMVHTEDGLCSITGITRVREHATFMATTDTFTVVANGGLVASQLDAELGGDTYASQVASMQAFVELGDLLPACIMTFITQTPFVNTFMFEVLALQVVPFVQRLCPTGDINRVAGVSIPLLVLAVFVALLAQFLLLSKRVLQKHV